MLSYKSILFVGLLAWRKKMSLNVVHESYQFSSWFEIIHLARTGRSHFIDWNCLSELPYLLIPVSSSTRLRNNFFSNNNLDDEYSLFLKEIFKVILNCLLLNRNPELFKWWISAMAEASNGWVPTVVLWHDLLQLVA